MILNGPMGSQLHARGVATPPPGWSAYALVTAPQVVSAIHQDYARAGAEVHTANTFRTKSRTFPQDWEAMARAAVRLARAAAGPGQHVAASIAPLEDCYSPHLSPPDPGPEHRLLAEVLAHAGVDLLLCETFPHVGEGLAAVAAAVATGVETWASFTAGPEADLLTPDEVGGAAAAAVRLGAAAVLVNCVPATRTLDYVRRLGGLGVPFGAYANAGAASEGLGWDRPDRAAERYADLAATWVDAGATLVGACCGTGPEHIAALVTRFTR